MQELAPLIYDLAIMLSIAAAVVLLFQRIHQPIVLGYLVAGMVVGPHTPPYSLVTDPTTITTLSELGVIFLMFSLGLEFSFHKLRRVGFSASMTGALEVVMMFALGYGVGKLIGWSYYDSLFLGAALSISSTTIIIKAIDELKLKSKRFAELIFGVLIVEDLLAILLLVALSSLVTTKGLFSADMLMAILQLIVVVGGWFIVGYFLVPPLFRHIATRVNQEILTIVSVALCLLLVAIAAHFDYSAALGAFIMGSIIAETVLANSIEHLIRPIRDIFAAVFFISVGMLIDPFVIIEHWQIVLLVSAVTIIGKLISTGLGALLTGQSLKTSVHVGFGMAQVGEFSFIIAALGLALKVTTDQVYPIIVAVSVVTTFTTPYLIRFSGFAGVQLEKRLPEKMKDFLAHYASWVYRTQIVSYDQPFLQKITIRLFLNGIVVAIIFALIHEFVFPKVVLLNIYPQWEDIVCLCLAIGFSSPFIWGMLFSYRYMEIPEYSKTWINPIISIIWLVTLTEISFFSIFYFQSWITIVILSAIVILFFLFTYRHLEKSYHWFERQLLSNIKQDTDEMKRYQNLAPWDTHFVDIDVGEYSALIGKTLKECHIRQVYGVNIVAIYRGKQIIPAPRGEERIAVHDKLIVLGEDENIDAFRRQVEVATQEWLPLTILEKFSLRSFFIGKQSPLIGMSIRDSQIREKVNGMVVGIERDNVRILNPDPDVVLQRGDILMLVGDAAKMDKFENGG